MEPVRVCGWDIRTETRPTLACMGVLFSSLCWIWIRQLLDTFGILRRCEVERAGMLTHGSSLSSIGLPSRSFGTKTSDN